MNIDNKMKQRILGGIVLVALAVIIIPIIFSSSKGKQNFNTTGSTIPAQPAKPTLSHQAINQIEHANLQAARRTVDETAEQSRMVQQPQAAQPAQVAQAPAAPAPTQPAVMPAPTKPEPAPKPAVKAPVQQAPVQRVVKSVPAAKPAPTKHAKKPAIKKEVIAAHKAEKVITPHAWVVQLASFSNQKYAANLAKKLQSQQFAAYVRSAKQANKTLYRVMVGPVVKKSQAQQLLARINEKAKLKGIVVSYKPVQA